MTFELHPTTVRWSTWIPSTGVKKLNAAQVQLPLSVTAFLGHVAKLVNLVKYVRFITVTMSTTPI